ncbi:hypothetical protein BH09ACT4_BH09ACT4_11930 [soil metagenome]
MVLASLAPDFVRKRGRPRGKLSPYSSSGPQVPPRCRQLLPRGAEIPAAPESAAVARARNDKSPRLPDRQSGGLDVGARGFDTPPGKGGYSTCHGEGVIDALTRVSYTYRA